MSANDDNSTLERASENMRPGKNPEGSGWKYLERVKGIEPSSQAWEAHILPLNHTRYRQKSFLAKPEPSATPEFQPVTILRCAAVFRVAGAPHHLVPDPGQTVRLAPSE